MAYVEVTPTTENEHELKELLAATGARLVSDTDIEEAAECNRARAETEKHLQIVEHRRRKLVEMRRSLRSLEDRLAQAGNIKAEANAHFSAGRWERALHGYMTAIWLLKRGEPIVSRSLATDEAPRGG